MLKSQKNIKVLSASSPETSGSRISRKPARIALAEDDQAMREMLTNILRKEGYYVIDCEDGTHLLEILRTAHFSESRDNIDLIVSDIQMPGISGLEVMEKIKDWNMNIPTIIITSFGDNRVYEKVRELNISVVFDKPFETDDLIRVIRKILSGEIVQSSRKSPE